MVKETTESVATTTAPSHAEISSSLNGSDMTATENKKEDCHNIVKSSGVGYHASKKRICCDHKHLQHGSTLSTKPKSVSVSCQTDMDSDMAGIMAGYINGIPPGASSSAAHVADGTHPEGLLRLVIHNFRNMNNTVRGPAKVVSTVPWKIMVMPRQHVVAKKGTQKCLGFFLQCCPESYSESWSCQAAAELRLISQKQGVPNFVRKTNHVYTAKENDWGYSCFMTWADILDENQGYMKEEKVILEVYVKADQPKGILTYEAFCKKIQDYMRLSDLQSSRGLIDKALEVNQSAVKFCKDKDPIMKGELELQKTKLIEMKLKQSIERIEKGATLKQTIDPVTGALVPEGPRKEIDLKTAAARLGNAAKAAKAAAKSASGNAAGANHPNQAAPVNNNNTSSNNSTANHTNSNSNSNSTTGSSTPPGQEKHQAPQEDAVQAAINRTLEKALSAKKGGLEARRGPDGQEDSPRSPTGADEAGGAAGGGDHGEIDDETASTSDNEGGAPEGDDMPDEIDLACLDELSDSEGEEEEPYVCDSCLEDRLDTSVSEMSDAKNNTDSSKKSQALVAECQTDFSVDANRSLAWLRSKENVTQAIRRGVPLNSVKQALVAETARVVLPADQTDVINVEAPTPKSLSAPSTPTPKAAAAAASNNSSNNSSTTNAKSAVGDAPAATPKLQTGIRSHPFPEHVKAASNNASANASANANSNNNGGSGNVVAAAVNVINAVAQAEAGGGEPGAKRSKEQIGIGEQITAIKKFNLSEENEQKLIKLVTEESKHSLNSIRDTLERLVSLAGDSSAAGKDFDVKNAALSAALTQFQDVKSAAEGNAAAGGGAKAAAQQKAPTALDLLPTMPAPPPDLVKTAAKGGAAAAATGADQSAVPPPPQDPKPGDLKKLQSAMLKSIPQDKMQLLHELRDQDSKLLTMMMQNAGNLFDSKALADARQRQQSVQTDMSSFGGVITADGVRSVSPLSLELLAAHAQDLADGKTDELSKEYSSIIEQTEANRLAETVKKVEKRMKDIEKQTMTCRKELSDECERHYKEEQKLNKQLKQLQQQLHAANERAEKANNQLKDKRNEVKKLEKRLKQESQANAEAAELQAKIDQLEKDLSANLKHHNDEVRRLQKENQKLTEARDTLQQELSYATSEIDRLTAQLEEVSNNLKKLENNTEKWKSRETVSQATLREATERAKKAEVNLLEFKLEMGITSCQRAMRECDYGSQQVEDVYKRLVKSGQDSAKHWRQNLDEWNRYREKLRELQSKAKIDFNNQIDQIKGGRTLASLPPMEFPVLPMQPQQPKLPTPPPQTSPVSMTPEVKKIAPIGVNPTKPLQTSPQTARQPLSAAGDAPAPTTPSGGAQPGAQQQHISFGGGSGVSNAPAATPQQPAAAAKQQPPQQQQQAPQHHYSGGGGSGGGGGSAAGGQHLLLDTSVPPPPLPKQAPPASGTPQTGGGGQPPAGLQQQQPVGGGGGQFTPGFGASGNNGTDLWGVPGGGATASAHQQQQGGGMQMGGCAAFGSGANGGGAGFTPWSDNLTQHLTQTLFGGKSLTSLYEPGGITGGMCSGNMGWNSWAPGNPMATAASGAGGGGGYEQQQMQGGGGYGQNVVGGPSPSPIGTAWSPMQAQYGAMASQVLDLRASMESPLGDKSRQMPGMQTLIEQLHHTFPKFTSEKLMEAVEEYKHTSAGKSYKTQTLEAVAQGVRNLILTKQRKQMADGTAGWQVGAPGNPMGGPGGPGGPQGANVSQASSAAAAINISKDPMVGTEACGYCVDLLHKQPACTLSCKHKMHVKCAKEWFGGGQQTCPACRVYVLPPEDYPELS